MAVLAGPVAALRAVVHPLIAFVPLQVQLVLWVLMSVFLADCVSSLSFMHPKRMVLRALAAIGVGPGAAAIKRRAAPAPAPTGLLAKLDASDVLFMTSYMVGLPSVCLYAALVYQLLGDGALGALPLLCGLFMSAFGVALSVLVNFGLQQAERAGPPPPDQALTRRLFLHGLMGSLLALMVMSVAQHTDVVGTVSAALK
jgi:hypothetical protein